MKDFRALVHQALEAGREESAGPGLAEVGVEVGDHPGQVALQQVVEQLLVVAVQALQVLVRNLLDKQFHL